MNRQSSRLRHDRAGVTLIELMVVLVILGLIVGTVALNVAGYFGQGYKTRVRADMRNIKTAAVAYKMKYAKYPDSIDQLAEAGPNGEPAFLERVPQDPWKRPYIYKREGSKIILECYGEDGAPGGTENDMDFSSEDADQD